MSILGCARFRTHKSTRSAIAPNGPSRCPKAGVYAVRMGAVLSVNLRAALGDAALSVFHPQRRFLSLLSTADGRAIASWGRWSANGRWVWRWKDHIDRAFLERFASAWIRNR